MKLLGAVFYVFAVLAFVGSALGDGEGGDVGSEAAAGGASPDTGARVCPIEITENKGFKVIASHLVDLAKHCFKLGMTNKTLEQLKEDTSIEDYRVFFRGFCQKQELMKECLDEIPLKLEVCEDKIYLQVFQVFHGLLETLLFETNCAHEGENLALLGHGVMRHIDNKSEYEQTHLCGFRLVKIMQLVMSSDADIPSKLFLAHEEIAAFDKCFMSKDMDADLKNISSLFVKKIVETMKCIHPQDGTLVLCKTMDASLLTTPSVCLIIFPVKKEQRPRYNKLRARAGKCFENIHQDLQDEATGNMEAFSEYFKTYCTKTIVPLSCVLTTVVYAEACLNETMYKSYALIENFVENALAHLCAEEGKSFATITHGVYHVKGNSTDEPNAVSECLGVARVTKKEHIDDESLPNYLSAFRAVEASKDCFLDKLQSDKASFDEATTFMNEWLRKMECIHPEEGTVVLCETIVNN